MSSQEMVRLEIAGAKIKIPHHIVVQNFLDSLHRPAVQLPALQAFGNIPKIGERWEGQGGVNSGLFRGVNGGRDYFIIVPTAPEAFIEKIKFGGYQKDITGAKCEFDGWKNTTALCESEHDHPAAQWARGLTIEGHSDFYLLAKYEAAFVRSQLPELFAKVWHWTSTQYSPLGAWVQNFEDGTQYSCGKGDEYAGRAVRRLFI